VQHLERSVWFFEKVAIGAAQHKLNGNKKIPVNKSVKPVLEISRLICLFS